MATSLNDLIDFSSGDRREPLKGHAPVASRQVRPVSMQLVAYLDGHYVELRILTNGGESIVISCPGDSIIALQQHIEQISRQCPEIHSWNQTTDSQTTAIDVTSTHIAGS